MHVRCEVVKLGVKELIQLCIYCWSHSLRYTFGGYLSVWMLLSGNLQHKDDDGGRPKNMVEMLLP